jgi:hypothetical protein
MLRRALPVTLNASRRDAAPANCFENSSKNLSMPHLTPPPPFPCLGDRHTAWLCDRDRDRLGMDIQTDKSCLAHKPTPRMCLCTAVFRLTE